MTSGVQFEKWFTQGFELYKGSMGLLIVTTLLTALIADITIGILAGPMMAGLFMLTLRLHDRSEPVPQIGDLFKGFEHFANAFLLLLLALGVAIAVWIALAIAAVLVGWVPLLGGLAVWALYLLVMALSCVVSLAICFSLCLMVDRGMDLKSSVTSSLEKIREDVWGYAGFAIVASLAASAGMLLCGVGVVVTLPFYACVVVVAYRDAWGHAEGAEGAPPEAPAPLPEGDPVEMAAPAAEAASDSQPEGGEEGQEKADTAG